MKLILEVLTFALVVTGFCLFVVEPTEAKRKEESLKCRVIHVETVHRVPLIDGPVQSVVVDIPSRVCFYCEDQKVHCRDDEQF